MEDKSKIRLVLQLLIFLYLNNSQLLLVQYANSIVISDRVLNRSRKKQKYWSYVDEILSNCQFCRMFRMTRPYFDLLCEKINIGIGESEFKSEAYIESFLSHPDHI